MENHLGELWAHFDFLMPGFLGDERGFQRQWRKPIEEGGETLRAELLAMAEGISDTEFESEAGAWSASRA